MTNFEYLIILNLLSGSTFHLEDEQPLLPYGDFEGELLAQEFYIPEMLERPLVSAYELRRSLEHLQVEDYARAKFADIFVPKPPNPPIDPLTLITTRTISLGEKEEIEAASFFQNDFLYLKLSSGSVQFVRLADQPQPISVQTATIAGRVVPTGGGLFIVKDHKSVQQITPLAVSPPIDVKCGVDFMKVIGHEIFFVSRKCCLYVSQTETPGEYERILVTSGSICAFDASKTFNAIVVGTEKCILSVHSLTTHELAAFINLNGIEPEKLLITPAWGLIVVVAHKDVIIFSINGGLVGKVAIETEIRDWRAFSDDDGFDYVLFWDAGNRIGVFEALKPDEIRYIPTKNADIMGVQYLRDRRAIASLSKEGIVTLIPFSL
jgi:hypothetical protein